MPDEALKASLQGRPRQAPDFSPLALGHLHASCLAARELIKQYLSAPSAVQLDSLATAVNDIHHTLQLLDRRSALLVTSELSALITAMRDGQVDDADACAHTLVLAGERIADYVAHLQKPGAIDSALPLLPVINNCRACRGEELLSEMLVVASGIDLPDGSLLPSPSEQEIKAFVKQIRACRQPLMTGLVGWYNDEQKLQSSLSELGDVFSSLAESCDKPCSLQPLVPLFESAEFICYSVRRGGLDSSAALHKLFAQLERKLNTYLQADVNDSAAFSQPVSETLFLNFLYYVALSSETSPKAVALRRRFRLDRFISKGLATDRSQVQFDGVGERLSDSIRTAIELETEAAREWLMGADHSESAVSHIRQKLTQLEPAIMLLGAQESMRHMNNIDKSLSMLSSDDSKYQLALSSSVKEQIAESLVRLERSLDTELNAVRQNNISPEQNDIDSILSACLSEAQSRLLSIEEDVIHLFGAFADDQVAVSTNEVVAKLATIDSALQILPLPEVSPLLSGVQEFIARHQNKSLPRESKRHLATVMVSLGYYLDSVLQPNGAAGQLLLEAEEALLKLDTEELEQSDHTLALDSVSTYDETMVIGRPTASHEGEYDATVVDYAGDAQVDGFIGVALEHMSTIGDAVLAFEQAGNRSDFSVREVEKGKLISVYDLLAAEASSFKAVDLERLAIANVRLLKSPVALEHGSEKDIYPLLDESAAVLPQLINQLLSPYDKVEGLHELIDRIDNAAVDDNVTLAMDVQSILSQNRMAGETMSDTIADSTLIESTIADATLTNSTLTDITLTDSALAESTLTDSTLTESMFLESALEESTFADTSSEDGALMTLDNTLEQVFFRECQQHMATLHKGVNDALASRNWSSDSQLDTLGVLSTKAGVQKSDIAPATALPNRDMLRALHTLTGSAQTVDAKGIICIAQPLQKAALQKQRNGETFDRAETEYIGELLAVLDARMASMDVESSLSDDDPIMVRLNEFVARARPWIPERKSGLALNTNVSAIESVFEEEARELLESLRSDALRLSDDQQRDDAIDSIMSCLHTIKGSARMAGQLSLADRAHVLEDELRLSDGIAFDQAVQVGLGELQTLMLVDPPEEHTNSAERPEASQATGLTDAGFENMLSLSTQATVSQARLGSSMLKLREAFRDIESTSDRLQRLPRSNESLDSAAVQEMLSDLDSAKRMLGDALYEAEAEHTIGSRADTTLHQTLVRAQLVSLAEAHARFRYAAHDAASETDKQVEFDMLGDELSVDKAMFRKIISPIEHIIRNAVVHGIESGSERIASGKAEQGQVTLEAKVDGTDLVITVTDDGIGINKDAINQVLSSNGKPTVVSNESLRDALCEPGFTTHDQADQLGGRGLGLASVKQMVDELEGSLHLSEPASGGTAFTLRLPQKIRVAQVVLIEHQSQCFAIPVNYIHHVSDEPHDLASLSVEYNSDHYDCCSLDAVLERRIDASNVGNANQLVLIGVHDNHFALLVDKVIGYREIIAQPLGGQLANLQRYLGGAVLSDGRPVLMPDLNRLLSADKPSPTLSHAATSHKVNTKTALIVDDSITMRISAEMMLRAVGIEPSLARDGVEAMELLGQDLPSVLLVDIDMPRMNGFDFIRHLQLSHPEHTTPIIMISTRDTEEDREQAFELGAADYIVKPYTNEQLQSALHKLGIVETS